MNRSHLICIIHRLCITSRKWKTTHYQHYGKSYHFIIHRVSLFLLVVSLCLKTLLLLSLHSIFLAKLFFCRPCPHPCEVSSQALESHQSSAGCNQFLLYFSHSEEHDHQP